MSRSKLLTRLEYVLVASSAIGLIVAFETKQQGWWATLPITGTLVVNVLNRKREDKDSFKIASEELTDVEQRMLNKIQWLEDKVKSLPPIVEPARVKKLEAETKLNREAIARIEKRISSLANIENILPELQKNVNIQQQELGENTKAIAAIQQTIESLPTRKDLELQTKEAFNILQFKQKTNQEDIETLKEKVNSLASRREDLARLDRQVEQLREELDRQFGKPENEEYSESDLDFQINSYSSGYLPRQIETLKEQNTDFESAILQLQKVFKDLPSHREIETFKQRLLQMEEENNKAVEEIELQEIRAEIAELKTELERQKLNKQLELEQEKEENTEEQHTSDRQPRNILSWFSSRF